MGKRQLSRQQEIPFCYTGAPFIGGVGDGSFEHGNVCPVSIHLKRNGKVCN